MVLTMDARRWTWLVLVGLAGAIAGALALQRQRLQQLHAEVELARSERRGLEQLHAERSRLEALQPCEAERIALQRAADELGAIETKLAQLREARRAGAMQEPTAIGSETQSAPDWENVGRVTPEHALETALWAAANGEVDTLAQALLLEPETRAAAEGFLASLPPEARAAHGTPERLVALLTAREVPLGSMRLIARMDRGENEVLLRVRLEHPDGSAITRSIAARGQPGDWRLIVPANAIPRYRERLNDRSAEAP